MRIGFDAKRIFENNTGLGVYGRTLVRNLHSAFPELQMVLFAPRPVPGPDVQSSWCLKWAKVVSPRPWTRPLWRPWLMSRDVSNEALDVYHGLSNELPLGIQQAKCRSVVTIHDLIFRFFPETYGSIDRAIYDFKFRRACLVADRIVAVSESTKRDIIQEYRIAPERISVVYQTCDQVFHEPCSVGWKRDVQIRYRIPSEYILTVGSIIPRKNLMGLVKGWSTLPESRRLPLVVVGRGGKYRDRVRDFVHQIGMENRVFFLEGVPLSDLPALYQGAAAVAYLSHYEGFGIPVLEGIASRVPVVTSTTSSMPEAGGAAALFANPDSVDEIGAALDAAVYSESVRERLLSAGAEHLKRFEQPLLTRELMQVYHDVLR